MKLQDSTILLLISFGDLAIERFRYRVAEYKCRGGKLIEWGTRGGQVYAVLLFSGLARPVSIEVTCER